MADQFNALQAGTLSPEDYAQQQALNRQQRYAEMLMQNSQQPQGQMISGRYVAPSWAQQLQGPVNMLLGAYMGKQSDEQAAKLAEKIRSGKAAGEQKITDLFLGTSAVPAIEGGIQGPNGQMTKETTADMYGAGMELNPQYKQVAPIAGKAATAPDYAAALREINNPLNYGAGKDIKPLIYKKLSPDPTEQERNYKAAVADGSWNPAKMGGFNNYKNQMNAFQQAEIANSNARLGIEKSRAINEGIPIGGVGGGYSAPAMNQPVMNQPTGGSPVMRGNAPQPSIAPNAPAYAQGALTMNTNAGNIPVVPNVNLAGVSPKKQTEMAGVQAENLQTNVKNAYNAYPVIKEIQDLLPQSSSGYMQRGWTGATRAAGVSTDMSKADTQLDVLAPKLTMLQPRFEGPQGILDVKLYEAMAGRLADTSLPYEDRMEALKQLKGIYQRYAPNLDWSYAAKPNAGSNANPPAAAKSASSAPAGIDQAVWNVMTPQEQSLWQKR